MARHVELPDPAVDLLAMAAGRRFSTIMADPPWRFQNATGKVAPEHRRLNRYGTMTLDDIKALPVSQTAAETAHMYLWVPNALLPEGLAVMAAWGFRYKANVVWHKIRKDGGSDGRGVGFYFRNVTELLLFGVSGKNARTLAPGRTHSSNPVRQGHTWRCLGAVSAKAGRRGATRLTRATNRRGRPTLTTRKPICSRPCSGSRPIRLTVPGRLVGRDDQDRACSRNASADPHLRLVEGRNC